MAAPLKIIIEQSAISQLRIFAEQTPPSMRQVVVVRALNDVAARVRTLLIRTAQEVKNLSSQRGIRAASFVSRATQAFPLAKVVFTGKRIPLIDFMGRWLTSGELKRFLKAGNVERQKFRSARYRIEKTGALKEVTGGFIAVMPKSSREQKRGHRGIFVRKGTGSASRVGRLPLHERFGPSLPQIMEDLGPEPLERAAEFGRLLLSERINAHVELKLAQIKARRRAA